MSQKKQRTPSPAPTVTLDSIPKPELHRSSSEESIRVIHQAVLFPGSPHPGRVTYIRRIVESDAELIRRQQAAIALQPLTFAEELAARRKRLEMKAEQRKMEKVAEKEAKEKAKTPTPEITIIPASGKEKANQSPPSPTKLKMRPSLKEKAKAATSKLSPMSTNNRHQRAKTQTQTTTKEKTEDDKLGKLTATTNNTKTLS